MAKRYTPEEIRYIQKNYLTLSDEEMAAALGKLPKNIQDHRNRHGLNRFSRTPVLETIQRNTFRAQLIERELTPEEEADIIADLKRGFNCGELASDYGVPAGMVKKLKNRLNDVKQAA